MNYLRITKMKEIKAIIKPFKVNDILNRLLDAGYPNLTVTMAEGTGNFKGDESSLSTHFSITNSKVAKIVIVCKDSEVDKIVGIISSIAHTGNSGDGIIYVTEVQKVISIRVGTEMGE
jgi:nitrogen regulatory protein P-II 1